MLVVQCLLVLWCTIHVNVFVCYILLCTQDSQRGEINNSKQDGTTTSIQNEGERGFTFANSNCRYR